MKNFFRPNIGRAGRIMRAAIALLLLLGGLAAMSRITWLGVLLFISAGFVFFEAARGWCVARACGIKTRL
jgi:hypothetical protein